MPGRGVACMEGSKNITIVENFDIERTLILIKIEDFGTENGRIRKTRRRETTLFRIVYV